jgi:hypothetical protein
MTCWRVRVDRAIGRRLAKLGDGRMLGPIGRYCAALGTLLGFVRGWAPS